MGAEFQVNSYTTGGQRAPRIASDSGGNFVVVWTSYTQDGSFYGVFGQRYGSTGTTLGAEFGVNTYTTDKQSLPSVASDSGGNFIVVWQSRSQDGWDYGVFGQRYGSAGAPLGSEFRVNTYTTSYQGAPSVASGSGGNFVVVWQSNTPDGSRYGVFGQRYGSTGAPLGAEFRVNTYTTSTQRSPCVVGDSVGNFVVVWWSRYQDGSGYGIFGQRYSSAGAPLGAEFRVNTYTTDLQIFPSVASDPGGNFVVVWWSYQQEGSHGDVFGQRYGSSGIPLGAEFQVNTYTTLSQVSPSVASDSGGNFVVVWDSYPQDGSGTGVYGQRYDSVGAPLGAEFRVNTFTTNNQFSPSVAIGSGADFVVVWESSKQDGSDSGVFGQRFCAALSSVTISVRGTTTVCATSTGGTATVTDVGGGTNLHQWIYYKSSPGPPVPISGQTGTSYVINGANFAGGTPGLYYLACQRTPWCGSPMSSQTVTINVITADSDGTPPAVAPPASLTTIQSLCQ